MLDQFCAWQFKFLAKTLLKHLICIDKIEITQKSRVIRQFHSCWMLKISLSFRQGWLKIPIHILENDLWLWICFYYIFIDILLVICVNFLFFFETWLMVTNFKLTATTFPRSQLNASIWHIFRSKTNAHQFPWMSHTLQRLSNKKNKNWSLFKAITLVRWYVATSDNISAGIFWHFKKSQCYSLQRWGPSGQSCQTIVSIACPHWSSKVKHVKCTYLLT